VGLSHRLPRGPGIVVFHHMVFGLLAFYERVVACAAPAG
jgi:hypothetical protein